MSTKTKTAAITANTKTTLAGIALAALNLYANGVSLKQSALSVGLAVLGKLAAGA